MIYAIMILSLLATFTDLRITFTNGTVIHFNIFAFVAFILSSMILFS